MAGTFQTPIEPETKKSSSKVWLIVLIIVVLCCLLVACGFAGYWLWENGDRLIQDWFAFSYLV